MAIAISIPHFASSPHEQRLYVVIAVWAACWTGACRYSQLARVAYVGFWVIEEESVVVDVGGGLSVQRR